MKYKYFLNEPYINGSEWDYAFNVIDKGWLSQNGEYTQKLEKVWAKYIGMKHCFAVQSGTAALHTALLGMDIGVDDRVIIPNFTCSGDATAVIQTGAEPVIVDVEKETYGLDANAVEDALREHNNIKAIIPIHIYGIPCRDFKKILALAKKYKVKVLEDACESHGAKVDGKMTGSFGDMSVYSIRSEKMMGVGEGGFVLSNNTKLHDRAHYFATRACDFDIKRDGWQGRYNYKEVGMNYKLPHLLGAVGLAQFENLNEIIKRKVAVAKRYRKLLKNNKNIIFQSVPDNTNPVYWVNAFILPNHTKEEVTEIGNKLLKKGIEIRPGFTPLGNLDYATRFAYGNQSNGQYLFEHMIVIPSSVYLADNNLKQVKEIVDIINEVIVMPTSVYIVDNKQKKL